MEGVGFYTAHETQGTVGMVVEMPVGGKEGDLL